MAYKYEQAIKNQYELNRETGRKTNMELINELKEVYRKAKAFDEIASHADEDNHFGEISNNNPRHLAEYFKRHGGHK